MGESFGVVTQVLGTLFIIVGAALLGAVIGQRDKVHREAPDGAGVEVDQTLAGAATALTGLGAALLSLGWM